MDLMLSLAAAVAASGFAIDLFRNWRARHRPHVATWTAGIATYAAATWALALGLGAGWSEASFKLFYYLGAIATIPLLAAGSVALAFSWRVGRWFLAGVLVWVALGAAVTAAAPVSAAVGVGVVPAGSEVFGFTFDLGSLSLPGPRVFAAVSGALGTIVVVALALWSVIRFWGSNRRLAVANVLIVLGVVAPAAGGTFTAMGEAAALALSLLLGAVLLWLGFRLAGSARPVPSQTVPSSA